MNDNTDCDTNEKKDNKDIIVTKGVDKNNEMNIRSTVIKDNISLSNIKIVKKVNEIDENNFDKILQVQTQMTTLLTTIPKQERLSTIISQFQIFQKEHSVQIN